MLENTELHKWIRRTKYFRKISFELLWKILLLSFLREALHFVWVNALICLQKFFAIAILFWHLRQKTNE